jgi:hypothetical protein
MDTSAAQKLAELLESAAPEDRKSITAWLLERGTESRPGPVEVLHPAGTAFFMGPAPGATDPLSGAEWLPGSRVERLRGALAPGQESQLVTLRLPAERHAQLRQWCSEHDFSMAAVIRGLVEQFLEARSAPEPEAG